MGLLCDVANLARHLQTIVADLSILPVSRTVIHHGYRQCRVLRRRGKGALQMKVLWQALRAVTLESLAVAAVVLLVFGLPSWHGMQGQDRSTAVERVTGWFKSVGESVKEHVAPPAANERRAAYTEQRLQYYRQLYGQALQDGLERSVATVMDHVQRDMRGAVIDRPLTHEP